MFGKSHKSKIYLFEPLTHTHRMVSTAAEIWKNAWSPVAEHLAAPLCQPTNTWKELPELLYINLRGIHHIQYIKCDAALLLPTFSTKGTAWSSRLGSSSQHRGKQAIIGLYIYICIYICIYIYMQTYIYIQRYVNISVYLHIYVFNFKAYICIYVYKYGNKQVNEWI